MTSSRAGHARGEDAYRANAKRIVAALMFQIECVEQTPANGGHLLGAHILAPEGADSIQAAALAIRQGLTVDDVADTIFP